MVIQLLSHILIFAINNMFRAKNELFCLEQFIIVREDPPRDTQVDKSVDADYFATNRLFSAKKIPWLMLSTFTKKIAFQLTGCLSYLLLNHIKTN